MHIQHALFLLQHVLNIPFFCLRNVPQHDISSSQYVYVVSSCKTHNARRSFRAKRFEHAIVSMQDALNMLLLTKTHLVNAFFPIIRSQYAVSPP